MVRMHMYMYVCMSTRTVRMHMYMYMCISTRTVRMHVSMYVCMSTRTVRAHTHTTCVRVYVCTCVRVYVHMCVRAHGPVPAPASHLVAPAVGAGLLCYAVVAGERPWQGVEHIDLTLPALIAQHSRPQLADGSDWRERTSPALVKLIEACWAQERPCIRVSICTCMCMSIRICICVCVYDQGAGARRAIGPRRA